MVCEPVNVRVALQGLTLHPGEQLLEDAQAVLGTSLSTLKHLQGHLRKEYLRTQKSRRGTDLVNGAQEQETSWQEF